ncbi:MAG: TIGR00282 family metallophosphoesterase [Candidatus Saccharimonadales bacterium]
MKILYVGDVMGEMGIKIVEEILPNLKQSRKIDLVIAQAENLSDGKGTKVLDYERLITAGVDFCTGGNWSLFHKEIENYMSDPNQPIIRPANYPAGTPGLGWKYIEVNQDKVLVISLLGQIVGRDANKPVDNPLQIIDKILTSQSDVKRAATIVNFHGDYSSEKVVIGHYLDGRVTAVIGDHWHVPTADARILAKGTGHITDVGMCGSLDGSLGVKLTSVIPRWRDNIINRNVLVDSGQVQFNAVLIDTDQTGLATYIEQIQKNLN